MNAYLLSVIGTILVSAFITAIAPDGKTSVVVKAITRLACILVIIAPILQFLQSERSTNTNKNSQSNFLESVIQTDESFIQYYQEKRIRQTEQALQDEVFDKFHLQCSVRLEWVETQTDDGESKIKITRIVLSIKNTIAEKEKEQMCEYLTNTYRSEVLIE